MRWLGVRLQLLLVGLVVLLAAAGADRAQYFCKMMGRAVAECCCAAEHDLAAQHARATLQVKDCCQLIARSSPSVAAAHDQLMLQVAAPALLALLPALEAPEPSFRLVEPWSPMARAPPAIGPPRFIAHCALLI